MPYRERLLSRFRHASSQVDELLRVHQYLQQVVPVQSIPDHLLRAALTMLVSALDTLVHEIVANAIMYELHEGKSVFKTSGVKIDIAATLSPNAEERLRAIEAALRRQYSKQSFQSSRQIEGALATVGIKKIWTKLAIRLHQSPEDIKLQLDLIVRRRNQIVHEGDLDPLHNLQLIEKQDVEKSFEFARALAEGLIGEFTSRMNGVS